MNPRVDAPIDAPRSEKVFTEKELSEIKSLIETGFEKRIRELEQSVQTSRHIIQILIKDNYRNGRSMLHNAVLSDDKITVHELIVSKANINCRTQDGETALILAAQYGLKTIVQELIEAKAEINLPQSLYDGAGDTALHSAISGGHRNIAELLLKAGADMNIVYQACTPLEHAIYEKRLSIVELLLSHGAIVRDKKKLLNFLKGCNQSDPYVIAIYNCKQLRESLPSKEVKEKNNLGIKLFKAVFEKPKSVESKQDITTPLVSISKKS